MEELSKQWRKLSTSTSTNSWPVPKQQTELRIKQKIEHYQQINYCRLEINVREREKVLRFGQSELLLGTHQMCVKNAHTKLMNAAYFQQFIGSPCEG